VRLTCNQKLVETSLIYRDLRRHHGGSVHVSWKKTVIMRDAPACTAAASHSKS